MEESTFFSLLLFFQNIKRNWYIPIICMILGGLCGMVFHYFQPPIYETTAAFSVTIDYTQTGYLSDIQEDQAMRGLGSIIDGRTTLEKTTLALAKEELNISLEDLQKRISLEREDFRWILRVRDSDAAQSAFIANTWAKTAEEELENASLHAIKAAHLEKYLQSLESCLLRMVDDEQNQYPCEFPYFSELMTEIDKIAPIINEERMNSKGLFSAISFSLSKDANISTAPSLYGRNLLVLSGSLLGLLVALIFVAILWRRPK